MAGLLSHTVVFLAVNGFLIAVWLLTAGSSEGLERVSEDFTRSTSEGFWPIWVILPWGTALVIHAGSVLAWLATGGPARRRRRRRRREAARRMVQHGPLHGAIRPPTPTMPGASGTARAAGEPVGTRTPGGSAHRPDVAGRDAPEVAPERRWVTVMFTDIVNSTSLNEALGDEAWHAILAHHRRLVQRALAERNGEQVATQGDGCLARFPNPAEAVLCAIDIQRCLEEERIEGTPEIQLRIGIHAGEAVHDNGDLIGRVVNLASRVTAEAEPGEVLVTEPVADYLGGRLDFDDRGLRPLKGVTQPRHLLAVRWADEEAPAAATGTSPTSGGTEV